MFENQATLVVAEMACAHEGDLDLAHRLVDIAAEAKVDAVQLQLFSVRRLVSRYHRAYEKSLHLEIPLSEWVGIIGYAKRHGLQVWCNVFDEDTLVVAMNEGADALKLHSSDLANPRMLSAAASAGKPVSIAVGGSTLDEISNAVWYLREQGAANLIMMHGYQGYPTAPQDARLGFLETLKRLFGCPVGYQDHTDGSSELAFLLPLVAIGAGACILEKHYTDNRARKGTDYEAALDPEDLARFVRMVRAVDTAMGDGTVRPMSSAELGYRCTMKKTIVASRVVKEGEIFTEDMLAFMRGEPGLTPSEVGKIIGRKSRRDIPQYATVTLADLHPVEDRDTREEDFCE